MDIKQNVNLIHINPNTNINTTGPKDPSPLGEKIKKWFK